MRAGFGRQTQLAALPWRINADGRLQVLLVTSRTNGKWMLPKGWPMKGRSDAEAAAQEAFEEGGVRGIVSVQPLGSYAYLKSYDDGSRQPAQAIIYGLHVSEELSRWPEKGQRKRSWMSARKAAGHAFERDLSRFLRSVAKGRVVL